MRLLPEEEASVNEKKKKRGNVVLVLKQGIVWFCVTHSPFEGWGVLCDSPAVSLCFSVFGGVVEIGNMF